MLNFHRPRRLALCFTVAGIMGAVALLFLKPTPNRTEPIPTATAVAIAPMQPAAVTAPGSPSTVAAAPDPANNIQRFAAWLQQFNGSVPAARAQLAEQGIQLARARRVEMKSLIQSDPEAALVAAIPAESRTALPSSINNLLE